MPSARQRRQRQQRQAQAAVGERYAKLVRLVDRGRTKDVARLLAIDASIATVAAPLPDCEVGVANTPNTPLALAVQHLDVPLADLLLRHGADANESGAPRLEQEHDRDLDGCSITWGPWAWQLLHGWALGSREFPANLNQTPAGRPERHPGGNRSDRNGKSADDLIRPTPLSLVAQQWQTRGSVLRAAEMACEQLTDALIVAGAEMNLSPWSASAPRRWASAFGHPPFLRRARQAADTRCRLVRQSLGVYALLPSPLCAIVIGYLTGLQHDVDALLSLIVS